MNLSSSQGLSWIALTKLLKWTCMTWDQCWMKQEQPSIEYWELYAVAVGVLIWINKFKNSRILLHCDNDSVCKMINKSTSGCKNCMVLLG